MGYFRMNNFFLFKYECMESVCFTTTRHIVIMPRGTCGDLVGLTQMKRLTVIDKIPNMSLKIAGLGTNQKGHFSG